MYKFHLVKGIKLSFLLVLVFSFDLSGQKTVNLDTIGDIIYLGKFKLTPPTTFKSEYTYDPFIDKYIYFTINSSYSVFSKLNNAFTLLQYNCTPHLDIKEKVELKTFI